VSWDSEHVDASTRGASRYTERMVDRNTLLLVSLAALASCGGGQPEPTTVELPVAVAPVPIPEPAEAAAARTPRQDPGRLLERRAPASFHLRRPPTRCPSIAHPAVTSRRAAYRSVASPPSATSPRPCSQVRDQTAFWPESAGFCAAVGRAHRAPGARFQNRCLRPLGHSSKYSNLRGAERSTPGAAVCSAFGCRADTASPARPRRALAHDGLHVLPEQLERPLGPVSDRGPWGLRGRAPNKGRVPR
jgi:hypothetical protein